MMYASGSSTRTRQTIPNRIVFYEKRPREKPWHRYADILVPLIAFPAMILTAVGLREYVRNVHGPRNGAILLGFISAFMIVSCLVFVYICMRMNTPPIRFGPHRFRTNFTLTRSTSSSCFMRSVNSDLQYMVPFNSRNRGSYESIPGFDVPPPYSASAVPEPVPVHKNRLSSSLAHLKIIEV